MMRKFVLLFVAMTVALPAFADWKEEVLDEMVQALNEINEKMSDLPGVKTNSLYSFYTAMSGLCIGFASSTQRSVPEPIVAYSGKLNAMFMRGELPSSKDVHQLGLDCLTYMESEMIRNGMPKESIESAMVPMMKFQIQEIFSRFSGAQ